MPTISSEGLVRTCDSFIRKVARASAKVSHDEDVQGEEAHRSRCVLPRTRRGAMSPRITPLFVIPPLILMPKPTKIFHPKDYYFCSSSSCPFPSSLFPANPILPDFLSTMAIRTSIFTHTQSEWRPPVARNVQSISTVMLVYTTYPFFQLVTSSALGEYKKGWELPDRRGRAEAIQSGLQKAPRGGSCRFLPGFLFPRAPVFT